MQRVAVMCSEEDPAACHRRLLIGRVLMGQGVTVQHIRGDGRLQSEEELAREQEEATRSPQLSLFEIEETPPWRSARSVLPKKAQPGSSAS